MNQFCKKTVWLQAAFADLLDVQFRAVTPYKLFESTDIFWWNELRRPVTPIARDPGQPAGHPIPVSCRSD